MFSYLGILPQYAMHENDIVRNYSHIGCLRDSYFKYLYHYQYNIVIFEIAVLERFWKWIISKKRIWKIPTHGDTQYKYLHEGIKQIYHHFNHYLNQSKVTFVWVTIHVFRLWNNSSLKWWERITKVFTTCVYCTSSFECIDMFGIALLKSL